MSIAPTRLLIWALRIFLAALFALAATSKLADVHLLSVEIANYRLLPPRLVGLAAAGLPGVELICSACLLIPRLAGGAAWLAAAMLAAFSFAMAQALARGISLECGCFGASTDPVTLTTLTRDLVLLGLALVLALWRRPSPTHSADQRREVA